MRRAETMTPISGKLHNSDLNIVLTGFMGTGKSSVARELAHMLGRKVVDVDAEIERRAGKSISSIFAEYGEPRFRDLETEATRETAKGKSQIISTGGGVVLRKENMDALRGSGIVFCLFATPEAILERTRSNKDRPLLQTSDPLGKIRELLETRDRYYRNTCSYMIDTVGKTPGEVAREILEKFCLKAEK